jgi:anti-anti-sigma regulatory factor
MNAVPDPALSPPTPPEADFVLPSVLTMATVHGLLEQLDALALAPGKPLIIDAAHTETLTTSAIQVLISLIKKVNAVGGQVQFHGAPEPFVNAWRELGLLNILTPSLPSSNAEMPHA